MEVVGTQTEVASNFVAVVEGEIEHLENLPSCLDFAAAFVEEYLHVVVAAETAGAAAAAVEKTVAVVEKTVAVAAAFA